MASLSGFPYFEVQLNKGAEFVDPAETEALLEHLSADPAPTDLVVISHGWNNDMARARQLYGEFFSNLRQVIDSGQGDPLAGRHVSVAGILWPSKKFADKELIPGGAAAFGDDVSEAELEQQIGNLMDGFDSDDANQRLERARQLVIDLENSPNARRKFVDELRGLITEEGLVGFVDRPDIEDDLMTLPGDILLDRLGTPLMEEEVAGAGAPIGGAAAVGAGMGPGDAQGSAAGFGNLFSGIKAGASNLLNLLTYYKMKKRARLIGTDGVYPLLERLRAASPELKLHLVGHSFGGLLVTAAVAGPDDKPAVPVSSLTLLQAAFSHHGIAENWDDRGNDGHYRRVLSEGRVQGPVVVTHTVNDKAVGRAYPLASRIARQVAAALGDANDKYGGIGRNGAQKTPEARFEELLDIGGVYTFSAGAVHNLKADSFIANHSDVANRQTANVLLGAILAT